MPVFVNNILQIICAVLSFPPWVLIRIVLFFNDGPFRNSPLFSPKDDGDPNNDDPNDPDYDRNPKPYPYTEAVASCLTITQIVVIFALVIAVIMGIGLLLSPMASITAIVNEARIIRDIKRDKASYSDREAVARGKYYLLTKTKTPSYERAGKLRD